MEIRLFVTLFAWIKFDHRLTGPFRNGPLRGNSILPFWLQYVAAFYVFSGGAVQRSRINPHPRQTDSWGPAKLLLRHTSQTSLVVQQLRHNHYLQRNKGITTRPSPEAQKDSHWWLLKSSTATTMLRFYQYKKDINKRQRPRIHHFVIKSDHPKMPTLF